MTEDTFDKITLILRICFFVIAVISFFSGRWLDLIIALLIAFYGQIPLVIYFGWLIKRPTEAELEKKVVETSVNNIRNIRNLPKGTIHDVIIDDDSNSYYAHKSRTIKFSDVISEQDLEEAINFLIGLCRNNFAYDDLRKMMRKTSRKPIEFTCQAHLVFIARAIATQRLSYWKATETKSLAEKFIYPWSYEGSMPAIITTEYLEMCKNTFENF